MTKVAKLSGDELADEKERTFVFEDEDHTLGNVLRYIISSYPDVEFCGYTIPHPSESKMQFRIQSNSSKAIDILKRGLEDLKNMCDYTLETFENEVDMFKKNST